MAIDNDLMRWRVRCSFRCSSSTFRKTTRIAGELGSRSLRLKVHGQHIIHHGGLAKIGAGNKLGLLSGFGGSFDQNAATYLCPDIPRFTVLQNIDNQPNSAVAPVTWLP